MKKLVLLFAAAAMLTGGAFAQGKACCKKKGEHCTKACCKNKKDAKRNSNESANKDLKTAAQKKS